MTERPSRRHVITGSLVAAAGGGVLAGGAALAPQLIKGSQDTPVESSEENPERRPIGQQRSVAEIASSKIPFYGERQAGVTTAPQAHASLLAFNLRPGITKDDLRRLLTLLTDDAARFTQGRAPATDVEHEMTPNPANLTVTFGFGQNMVKILDPSRVPVWLKPLPKYSIDALQPQYTGGDLLLQICCDDPLTLHHVNRFLIKVTRSFARIAWVQDGFRQVAPDAKDPERTQRNLFGQMDGTGNPTGQEREKTVYGSETLKPWMPNATSLVLRRIRMDLDGWDRTDRPGREAAVGRTLGNGAPMTGTKENDPLDFEAKTPLGFPVIPAEAHVRRAAPAPGKPEETMLRRVYNYEHPHGDRYETGLLFCSFQADVNKQYIPVQNRLVELDALNQWTTPVGSAVFLIPPGCSEDGFIGDVFYDQ